MRIAGKIILIFIALLIFSAILLLLLLDYNTLIVELAKLAGSKSDNLMRQLLTPGKLMIVKVCLSLFLILVITLLFYWNKIISSVSFFDVSSIKTLMREIKIVFIREFVYVLLIVPVGTLLYFALTLPVSYDEAFTYSNFSSKGVLTSMAYYPFPNNHIFFSIITSLSLKIPLDEELFLIRLPSIIVHILSITASFFFFRHIFREVNIAYMATSLMSMLFMSIYFGYMARGYSIELLSFILLSFSAFLIAKESRNFYWLIFFMASVLGFYTIPSFLYAFILVNLFVVAATRRITHTHLIVGVLIVATVVALYLPIIVINGLDALVSNKYVKPIGRLDVINQLPGFFNNAIEGITGIVSWLWLIFLLPASWFLTRNNNRSLKIYFLLGLICPAILLVLHSVIPFGRTFNYYVVFFSLLVVIPLAKFLTRLSAKYVILLSVAIQVGLLINFNYKIKTLEGYAIVARQANEKLMDGRSFYVNDRRFITYLIFELETHGIKEFDFIYRPSEVINADTIKKEYDYYIIEKENDKTVNRALITETKFFNVYQ